tara:strand:+ start:145 stop:543 length:399 start_codon:yes stop_codon:yes gene_type:complete
MANFKITYKNHCTPQEYLSKNTRWYLDSDVKAKLTGMYTHTTTTQPAFTASATLAASGESPVTVASSKTFVYVKNTGSANAVLSLSGNYSYAYRILLIPGESFTSMIDTTAVVVAKSTTSTATTIEYLTGVN